MKSFLLLLSFMTRLYLPKIKYDEEELGKGMKFFPIVGFIIGIFLFLTANIIIFYLTMNFQLMIIFVLLVEVILTGGIHLDGLADTFDGIFSYRSKQKMLEIMKDSRIGTNGVIALILDFLLKFFLLDTILAIFPITTFLFAILTYPIASRFCSVVSCASAPYARSSGMAKTFIENTKMGSFFIAFILSILLIAVYPTLLQYETVYLTVLLIAAFLSLIILTCTSVLFSKLMTRKIGGITGDTLGALLELSSVLYLFLLIVIASQIMNRIYWGGY